MSAPVLGATRVSLRPLTAADLAWLHTLNAIPDVRRYLFDDEAWSADEVRARLVERNAALWTSEGLGLFVVSRNENAIAIGWCGFWYFPTRLGFTETHRSMGDRHPLRHYARGREGLGPAA
ncbi:MAG: GNAT family N-acetyltransferase [Cytophagaceae bacterium]|nr:GNAT family N-acetyltransferase [Gemmatimonadaceae bacterium]